MPSLDSWGLFATRWDMKDMPDLTGKVAIVTGGNTGIGLPTCQELARKGAIVYMLSRSQSRAHAAIDKIKQDNPAAQVKFIQFDLTSIESCKKAAAEFLSKENRLDILINNAGIMMTPFELSVDGIELQACNATGHYALTMPLLPILKSTAALPDSHVRIINVTSDGHQFATPKTVDFTSVDGLNGKAFATTVRYGNSKLANIYLTDKLQELFDEAGTGIRCFSVHPGGVNTELIRGPLANAGWFAMLLRPIVWLFTKLLLTSLEGALTQLYAATSPNVEQLDIKGAYLIPFGRLGTRSNMANDKESRDRFWQLCDKLVAESS